MKKQQSIPRLATSIMLTLGILLTAISVFVFSSFMAILGVTLIFWAVVLLYIAPSKQVSLSLFNASSDLENVERILIESNCKEKGIYLPPRSLKDPEKSLVYVPCNREFTLPKPEDITDKLFLKEKNGLLLTPPGFLLSLLFEQELETSLIQTNIVQMQKILPKLLVESLEIAERVDIEVNETRVYVKVAGSVFDGICRQTYSLPHTHEQVGCILTSAIACALAKSSGKPVIIQKESNDSETKTLEIEYTLKEE